VIYDSARGFGGARATRWICLREHGGFGGSGLIAVDGTSRAQVVGRTDPTPSSQRQKAGVLDPNQSRRRSFKSHHKLSDTSNVMRALCGAPSPGLEVAMTVALAGSPPGRARQGALGTGKADSEWCRSPRRALARAS
jgi:hypothetical protein